MPESIEVDFDDYDPKPRPDGKYRFAIDLGDLDGMSRGELAAILASPEALALDEAALDFDSDHRNGIGALVGWREATAEELARLEAKRGQSRDWATQHDRQELERIKRAHPEWLDDPSDAKNQ